VAIIRPIIAREDDLLTNRIITHGVTLTYSWTLATLQDEFSEFYTFSYLLLRHKCSFPKKKKW